MAEGGQDGAPLNELRLGQFRKENLKYRLTDDPTAVHKSQGDAKEKAVDPEDRAVAEKVEYGISFLKETAVFGFFLGCFIAVVFLTSPPYSYESVALVKQVFVDQGPGTQKFTAVNDAASMKVWLETILLKELFSAEDFNGKTLNTYDRQFVRGGNRVIGPLRLRQVRSNARCKVMWWGRFLRVRGCSGLNSWIDGMEETRSYGTEHYVNGVPGYTQREVDSLVAQGLGANVTTYPTRFRYSSSDALCSEVPNPDRDTGSFVDSKSRIVRGANKGLEWYCKIGSATAGHLGVVYPDGGYTLDLPPVSYYAAYDAYQTEKLLHMRSWNRRHGPFGPYIRQSRTETVTETEDDGFRSDASKTEELNVTLTTPTQPAQPVVTPTRGTATVSLVEDPEATSTLTDVSLHIPPVPSKKEHAMAALEDMLSHNWIDNKTVMVSAEFTMYNANTNIIIAWYALSCCLALAGFIPFHSRFVMEFLASGQVLPYFAIRPMLLPVGETASEKVVLVAELFLTVIILYYAAQEGIKIYTFFSTHWRHCQVCCMNKIQHEHLAKVIVCPNCQRHFDPFIIPCCPDCYFDVETSHKCWKGYFLNLWNVIDLVNICIFIAVFAIRFKLRADVSSIVLRTETQFIQLFSVADQYALSNYLNAVNVMLSFLKTIKYLGRVRALSVLIKTLAIATSPLLYFFVVFGIIYFGFSLSFNLAFGDTREFRDTTNSLMSLFRMMLGEFNYTSMRQSQPYLAPILFLIYNTAMVVILSNIFISIIDESYQKASLKVKGSRIDYLNSALKFLYAKVVRKIDKITGNHSDTVEKFRTLGKSIYIAPSLSAEEKDEVRQIVKEIVEMDEIELIHDLLFAFHHDVTRVMRADDFELLKARIEEFKQEKFNSLTNHYDGDVFWAKTKEKAQPARDVLTHTDKSEMRRAAEERRQSFARDRNMLKKIKYLEGQLAECMAALNLLASSQRVPCLDQGQWLFEPAQAVDSTFTEEEEVVSDLGASSRNLSPSFSWNSRKRPSLSTPRSRTPCSPAVSDPQRSPVIVSPRTPASPKCPLDSSGYRAVTPPTESHFEGAQCEEGLGGQASSAASALSSTDSEPPQPDAEPEPGEGEG